MGLVTRTLAVFTLLTVITVEASELEIRVSSVSEMAPRSGSDENCLLLKVELPERLTGARIDRAVLKLPIAADSSRREQPLLVAPTGRNWSASQSVLLFEDLNPIDSLSAVQFVRGNPDSETAIDITSVVSAWVNGITRNHGLIVSGLPEQGKSIRLSREKLNLWNDPPLMSIRFTHTDRK